MSDMYVLRVTAGPDYDMSTHKVVAVNTGEPLHISSENIDVDLNVRIEVRFCVSVQLPTPLISIDFKIHLV